MFKKILIALVLILAVLAVVIATRPDDFRVTRSATIAAPPAALFEQVNDLKKWEAWSPWAKLDPNSKMTYEGAPSGAGAIARWNGNNDVGEGIQTITESRPGELVRMKLEVIRPFAATNDVDFTFKPEGAGTLVIWTMSGQNGFLQKAAGLVMDCDKMCGDFFIQGLANLKAIVEPAPKA